MIHAIRANRESFRAVEFTPGLNVVLADRTQESTRRDTRNGLGKSLLLQIMQFCLGAGTRPNIGLRVPALRGWVFEMDLDVGARRVIVRRSVDHPSRIQVEGETHGWPIEEDADGRPSLSETQWNEVLGLELFGLTGRPALGPWSPTFRSLAGHLIRHGPAAHLDPFTHHRYQKEWDKQVNNAFLLGLSWQDARDFHVLKEEEKALDALKKGREAGIVSSLVGSVGELEAEQIRLNAIVRRQDSELASFQVHPQYREIEAQANTLTARLHELANQNVRDRRLLAHYRSAIAEAEEASAANLRDLYERAGVSLPGVVVRRLEDVEAFHRAIVRNRQDFLAEEIAAIEARIGGRDAESQRLDAERASVMQVLSQHGALEEYNRLQQRHLESVNRLRGTESRLADLRRFEEGKSAVRIKREQLQVRARRDYDERRAQRERAIQLFNAHSEALYEVPGRLVIDVGPTGFRFQVEIERAGSHGIEKMKIWCYDTMLAQLWATRTPRPGILVHDSTIFEGVDERQRASALERASAVSSAGGLQYICTFNSDELPLGDFTDTFDVDSFVRLRLTDARPEGSLLGFRF